MCFNSRRHKQYGDGYRGYCQNSPNLLCRANCTLCTTLNQLALDDAVDRSHLLDDSARGLLGERRFHHAHNACHQKPIAEQTLQSIKKEATPSLLMRTSRSYGHVFDQTRPILLVSRTDDNWCFLCGENHPDDASAYKVIGIGHVFDQDPSLRQLDDLPPNWDAERKRVGEEWVRRPLDQES